MMLHYTVEVLLYALRRSWCYAAEVLYCYVEQRAWVGACSSSSCLARTEGFKRLANPTQCFQKPLWNMWRRQKKKQMLTIITGACVKTTHLHGIHNRFWKDVHFGWCPQYFGSIVNFVVRLQSKKSTTLPQFFPSGKLQKQRWCYILCFLKKTFLKHVRATEDMLLRMIASETTQKHWKKHIQNTQFIWWRISFKACGSRRT